MTTDRDMLLGVADTLRKLSADPEVRHGCPALAPRLKAIGDSIERALLANAFEQPPSLKEWRRMVEATKC